MKKFLKRIRRLWCKHDGYVFEGKANIKCKFKKTKRGYSWRYDIWENVYCPYCAKLIDRMKVRSDLTENQLVIYLKDHYGYNTRRKEGHN